jgi:outer membrane protein assembly factor BamB
VYDGDVRKVMENHHGGVVLVDGCIFGCSGNCNGRAPWVCQDFKTGKKIWSEEKLDPGSITCADGLLYLYSQKDGACVLIEASKAGWKEHGRFKIPHETAANRKKGKIWTHPVVADGHLFLRDNELIFCYDVRANSKSE